MRKLLLLPMIFMLIWSCEWRPEEVDVFGDDSYQLLDIVVGVKTTLEIEGHDFLIIELADTAIVDINTNDSGYFEIIGRNPGITRLSLSYTTSFVENDIVEYSARKIIALEVTNGFPLDLNIEDSLNIDLLTFIDSGLKDQIDSVDLRYSEGLMSMNNLIELNRDNLVLHIEGLSPGREVLFVTFFNEEDTLIPSIVFDLETKIHKTVFAELYTNSGCVNCPEANHYLDNLLVDFEDDFVLVRYHVNWTDPFDPMNLYNPGEVEARRAYYNIFAAPGLVLDGTLVTSLDEDDWSGRVFNASQEETPIYISPVSVLESVDSLHLEYDLDTFGKVLSDLTSWTLVLEDSIDYAGSNGETIHMQVMRDMTSSSLSSLNTLTTIQHSLKKPEDYGIAGPMNILVFIQSESDKAVLQSRKQNLY